MSTLADLLSVNVDLDIINANFGDRILKHVITGTAIDADPEACQEMIDRLSGKSFNDIQHEENNDVE